VLWAQERWPEAAAEISVESLESGREAFVRQCAGCHFLPRPQRYEPGEWAGMLDEMVREQEVLLEPADRELIGRYVAAAAAIPKLPEEEQAGPAGAGAATGSSAVP
jgi:mono/diheme cytochrome c family protein